MFTDLIMTVKYIDLGGKQVTLDITKTQETLTVPIILKIVEHLMFLSPIDRARVVFQVCNPSLV